MLSISTFIDEFRSFFRQHCATASWHPERNSKEVGGLRWLGHGLVSGHKHGAILVGLNCWINGGSIFFRFIVTDIHLEHNLEKIKQDRCRERTSHLEHHQISHLEHPVLY